MTPEQAYANLIANDDIVLDALDRRASEHPDKTYIYYGEDDLSFTYGEFKKLTDKLAAGLAAAGVLPGHRVSVLTRNSLLSVLSMFAIWRSSGIFAPINFNFTKELIETQLHDTQPSLVITDTEYWPIIQEIAEKSSIAKIVIHRPKEGDHDHLQDQSLACESQTLNIIDFEDLKTCANPPPIIKRTPFDDANIMYTSGTTGRSKGVVQRFRWISYYAQLQYTGYSTDDVVYCDLPMYHVAGAFALTTRALWAGCTIGIWDRFSPAKFWDRIRKIGASNAILLDVMITWLMAAPPSDADRKNTLNKVHMQPLPKNYHEVAERFGFDIVTCGYGQTESGSAFFGLINESESERYTPDSLWKGLPKDEYIAACRQAGCAVKSGTDEIRKGFMGHPNPLLEVAVLDENDNRCDAGAMGQLCYRPRYPGLLLKEYFNNPAGTAAVLKNCWYHTGDAGYEDANERGTYIFMDRMGGFFRVRGENVSSFEVESLIGAHPAVESCAAVAIPAKEGHEDDIAVFIVRNANVAFHRDEFESFLLEKLPKFMRPKYVKVVEKFPTTPTNKVEKYKLKESLLKELEQSTGT